MQYIYKLDGLCTMYVYRNPNNEFSFALRIIKNSHKNNQEKI